MMDKSWKPMRLDELGYVGRGKSRHRPRNDSRLYGGVHPFIQTADIMTADPYITEYLHTYSDFGILQSKQWPANTLCITIAGANTAKTAILKFPAYFPDSIVGFIPDPHKSDLHFVKYSLDLMRNKFLSVSRGATQDNLSLDKLLSFPIYTPPIEDQKRIGEILSSFDNLIANNGRRIKILEEMSKSIYREWFVNFRYPGYVEHKATPLGETSLPTGWEARKVSDFADFERGIEPGSDSYMDEWAEGLVKFLRVGDLSKRESDLFIPHALARNKYLNRDDIALTLDGSVGLVRIGLSGSYSTGIRKLVIKDESRLGWSFAYNLLLSDSIQDTIRAHAKGTTILHAGSAVKAMQFISPPESLIVEFERVAAPMLRQILTLSLQISKLSKMRDLLLLKLLPIQINN